MLESLLNQDVLDIFNFFNKHNIELYLVGGAIRNYIIGENINDYDFCTNLKPNQLIYFLQKEGYKVIFSGVKYGTITVFFGKSEFEITTYREEKYNGNRKPTVKYINDIKKDLSRRDFTINSLAYNPEIGFIDLFNGINDINNKKIKTVGNPDKRFAEDPLRILRAVRFASVYNFNIYKETFDSLKRNIHLINIVSRDRILAEFKKILTSDYPSYGLELLAKIGFFKTLYPDIHKMIGFNQNTKYHDKDLWEHTKSVVSLTKKNYPLRMAALLHDIGKTKSYQINKDGSYSYHNHNNKSVDLATIILDDLNNNNKDKKIILLLIKYHMLDIDHVSNKWLKKFSIKIGEENMYLFFNLLLADRLSSAKEYQGIENILDLESRYKDILKNKENFTIKDLYIDGNDLLMLGYKEGPAIGKQLNYLLNICLDDPKNNNREFLLNISKI